MKSPPAIERVFKTFVCLLFCVAGVAHADTQFPRAGRVGLQPPSGMTLSTNFAGFEDRSETASILIAEMPAAAYAQLDKGLTEAALASKGMVVADRREWPVAGASAFLIRGKQTAGGMEFRKWLLVAGNDELTALLTVQVPNVSANYSTTAVENALRSVSLRAPSTLEQQIAALPFRVTNTAGFRVTGVIAGSGMMLSDTMHDATGDNARPNIVVAWGLGVPPARNQRDAFARRALTTLPNLEHIEIERSESYDGDWHRTEANAMDNRNGETLRVIQIIRFLPHGWIRTGAVLREASAAQLSPRIQRLASSAEPRSP
jgi:hypothetical protein